MPCPDNEANPDVSVNYEMPRSVHVHKSMLLRGVKHGPPTLDRADIEGTKSRANSSGRSFGGPPLRGGHGNGRGRGGHINYANDRPNPFAAHLNPGFAPPPNSFGRGGPPPHPVGQFQGYPPPPRANGSYGGPPPPPQNGFHGAPPPPSSFARQIGPPQPPAGGYYNGPPQPSSNGYGGNYGGQPSDRYGPPQDGRYGGYSHGGR